VQRHRAEGVSEPVAGEVGQSAEAHLEYPCCDLDCNFIGSQGCQYLLSMQMERLIELGLGIFGLRQPTTKSETGAAFISQECSWTASASSASVAIASGSVQPHRRAGLQLSQQGPLEGTRVPQPRYFVTDAGGNGIGAIGCRHLSRGHWPVLSNIELGSTAVT
jgi:hypothetical protein